MYCPLVTYDPSEYIETSSGLKVSRKATICNSNNVETPGGKVKIYIAIILYDVVI